MRVLVADGAFVIHYTEVPSTNVRNKSRRQPKWSDHPSQRLGGEPSTHHGNESKLVTNSYTGHISAPVQTYPGSNLTSHAIVLGVYLLYALCICCTNCVFVVRCMGCSAYWLYFIFVVLCIVYLLYGVY